MSTLSPARAGKAIDTVLVSKQKEHLSKLFQNIINKLPMFSGIMLWVPVAIVDLPEFIAGVDDKTAYFGQDFFTNYEVKEQMFIVMHEMLHYALRHYSRAGRICHDRYDRELFNIAADVIINESLIDSAIHWYKLPEKHLNKTSVFTAEELKTVNLPKLTVEQLYRMLKDKHQANQDQCGGGGGGEGQESQSGNKASGQNGNKTSGQNPTLGKSDRDLISPDQISQVRAAVTAHVGGGDSSDDQVGTALDDQMWANRLKAMQAGTAPGSFLRKLDGDIPEVKTPWQRTLKQYMKHPLQRFRQTDWSRPFRAALAGAYGEGVFMPATQKRPGLDRAIIAMDVSGSCWDPEVLKEFAANVQEIQAQTGCEIVLMTFDHGIQDVYVIKNDGLSFTEKLKSQIQLHGGGGTTFRPLFDPIVTDRNGVQHPIQNVRVMVVLTDLYADFPEKKPNYPVIWAGIKDQMGNIQVPFGKILVLE